MLSTAILTIQQPMAAALDAGGVLAQTAAAAAFTRIFSPQRGRREAVRLGLAVAPRRHDGFSRVASVGVAPGLDPRGPQIQELLDQRAAGGHLRGRAWSVGDQSRIVYALADRDTGYVVYAERAIPADRRASVDRNSAYAELDYAHLSRARAPTTPAMTTTDVDPASLPLDGLTAQAAVPFGDTVLTLVTSPRQPPGQHPEQATAAGSSCWRGCCSPSPWRWSRGQLARSRQRAESDTETITTLYQRVDSLYGEQREHSRPAAAGPPPQVNPGIPGIEISSEYVAGAQGVDIGGDWYSAIAVGDETFAFVVGDVSGNGVDAVAEMARARFTLRAYLVDGDGPATALEKCSRQFDIAADGHIVTVLVGVGNWRPARSPSRTPAIRSRCSSRTPGASFVPMPVGPPLGAGPCTYDSATFTLPSGATLIAYTDGLVERRTEEIDAGMHRLVEAVRPLVARPLPSHGQRRRGRDARRGHRRRHRGPRPPRVGT